MGDICVKSDVLYRYVIEDSYSVKLVELEIIRRTPKGVWLQLYPWSDELKFTLNSGLKRFAYPTEAEAFESLMYRKRAAVGHAESRLKRANIHLRLAEAADEARE